MKSILLNALTVKSVKDALHPLLPAVKSAHLSEALAAALGFGTNAALASHLTQLPGSQDNRPLDIGRLCGRLQELGYPLSALASREFIWLRLSDLTSLQTQQVAEPNLDKGPKERCYDYGIRIERDAEGSWWAKHPVAGVAGPYPSDEVAALEAWIAWGS